MKKRPHVLKENRSTNLPYYYIVFDTETLPKPHDLGEVHEFRLAVAYFFNRRSRKYPQPVDVLRTKNHEELWNWIESHALSHQRLYVFAHNIDYDVTVSKGLEFLQNCGYEIKKWFVQDKCYYMKWQKDEKTIILMDTFSIFPYSLKYIGQFAGLEKAQMPDWGKDDDTWFEYCERDVQVLSTALYKYFCFIRENDLGNFAPTIAGQAFNAFRHRFMKTKIYVHALEDVETAEIESYYGGRCEAWFIGKVPEKLYYVDVNSMYPFVMKYKEYPTQYIGEIDNPSLAELKKIIRRYAVIARITVDTDLPILPYRMEKTIFPTGRFLGWYATPEVELALRKGVVVRCHKAFIYLRENIFSEYVDFFYNMKREAKEKKDKARYVMSKLFLNSLYGKFGQRVAEMVEVSPDEITEEEAAEEIISMADGLREYIRFAGKIYRKERREPSFNSFIAIASHVTSYARVHLWSLIEEAGLENVYYMDTDSLFVNERGYQRLQRWLDDEKLGYLKLEKTGENVTIMGAKAYIWGEERKIKGVPKTAKEIEPGKFEYDHFMKFRTKLRKGLLNTQIVEKRTRELTGEYDKGIVLENGRVIPLVISDI
ncbi:MAG: DNA polymerase [Candidatus Methanospirareceae archaeon]